MGNLRFGDARGESGSETRSLPPGRLAVVTRWFPRRDHVVNRAEPSSSIRVAGLRAAGGPADTRRVRLSRRILRQRLVRYGVAVLFVVSGGVALMLMLGVGAPFGPAAAASGLIAATCIPVALAPTDRMPHRWFHLLPVLIAVETCAAMWVAAPDSGPPAVTFIFIGAVAPLIAESWWALLAQLGFASVVLFTPVAAGVVDPTSGYTILAVFLLMWGLAGIVTLVWAHAEDAAAQLDRLARHDALTGVGNRRMLDERVEYELVRHMRSGASLALVVLDLNGFKQINDTIGHNAGDDVLRAVAKALEGAVRAQDTVARPGGDEFCVLAPEAGAADVLELVARVRAALEGVTVHPVSAGIGVALFPDDASTARDLFEVADARLREDKPVARERETSILV